jgi:hypothetical protein
MAGVALAGTVSSVGSSTSPTIGQTVPTALTTVRQEDRAAEPERRHGREAEARGRAKEPGEDVRHEDRATETEPGDDRGPNRGRHGGDDDGHSGHGPGGDD